MSRIIKKCMICGKQMHRTYNEDICPCCMEIEEVKRGDCSFCKETSCIAAGIFSITDKHRVFCDIRMDMEFNQIDAEFGFMEDEICATRTDAQWTDGLVINYCPVCGRKLPKTEYM